MKRQPYTKMIVGMFTPILLLSAFLQGTTAPSKPASSSAPTVVVQQTATVQSKATQSVLP